MRTWAVSICIFHPADAAGWPRVAQGGPGCLFFRPPKPKFSCTLQGTEACSEEAYGTSCLGLLPSLPT